MSLRAASLLCCAVVVLGAAPDFDATAPPHQTVMYSYPGIAFVFEVKITDDDPAGTPEGTISVTSTVVEGSAIAQGFNPLNDGAMPWISTTPLQSVNTTLLNGGENAMLFQYQVTDLDSSAFAMVPNPFRELCIEARDGGEEPPEGWNMRCYRIFILSGPRYDTGCPYSPLLSPEHPDGQPVYVDYCPKLALRLRTALAIGQNFEGNMYFDDPNHDGTQACEPCRNITISVLANPGLPNGAMLTETVGGPRDAFFADDHTNLMTINLGVQSEEPTFKHLVSRKLSFTPLAEQDLTYSVCVDAIAKAAAPGGLDSPSRVCLQLDVHTPNIRVLEEPLMANEPAPFMLGSEEQPAVMVSRLRCKESFMLTLWETHDFDPSITQTEATAGFEQNVYVPTARPLATHPLPEGFEVSEIRRVRTCSDAFRAPSLAVSTTGLPEGELRLECPPEDRQFTATQHLITWHPQKGEEGQARTVCFNIQDHRLPAHVGSYVRCTQLVVSKCEVCLLGGDTLLDIAKEFRTSWLQLWGANPWLRNPHHLPASTAGSPSVLSLGPLLAVARSQQLSLVAQRFGVGAAELRFYNPDLPPAQEQVAQGLHLCIVSPICAAAGFADSPGML